MSEKFVWNGRNSVILINKSFVRGKFIKVASFPRFGKLKKRLGYINVRCAYIIVACFFKQGTRLCTYIDTYVH